jgi:uncharacterized protein YjbI with pentapeptide repeats
MNRPQHIDDPAYLCLREDNPKGYHELIGTRETVDFSNTDLRGVDLRAADLTKVVLRGAYLREADLRGQDLRHHDLEGCSLLNARISGTYFPENIAPQEIANSVQYGTRIRTTC